MKNYYWILIILLVLPALFFTSCKKLKSVPKPFVSEVVHPDWTKKAVIYEVNIRQYTPQGSFNAFSEHLPRLKQLGVDILWLMPVNPIGVKNRKEALGSYYSVRDYKDVNPEFGTINDFRNLLDKAHEMGFHVIIDWIPNHSSWDNKITIEHPDWYVKDSLGRFTPPIGTDWTDVIQLDWSKKGLQDYMIDALKFWVKMGVDGFRVDHPHKTPYAFWERARIELDSIRPIFLVAENEEQTDFMKKAFDMNYSWELHHLLNRIAQGKDSLNSLRKYYKKEWSIFPSNVYRMVFLDNHDENSWNGTIRSRLGEAHKAAAVFMFTTAGFPLLYNGQEVCLDKSLKFFVRDTIKWDTCKMTSFYRTLIRFKKSNPALWNGEAGGTMEFIKTNKENKIFAYFRAKENNRILVFLNLSKKNVTFIPAIQKLTGEYRDFSTGQNLVLHEKDSISLEAWGFKVLAK